jgi:hypothetical protein
MASFYLPKHLDLMIVFIGFDYNNKRDVSGTVEFICLLKRFFFASKLIQCASLHFLTLVRVRSHRPHVEIQISAKRTKKEVPVVLLLLPCRWLGASI